MHEHPNSIQDGMGAEHILAKGAELGDFQSRWSNDQGDADPRVLRALASGDIDEILSALAPSRLFIALVAEIAGEPSEGDKNSDMSVAALTASDGRLGLLCFTSLEALKQWNPQARPVPIAAPDAAQAALDENAQAIIVDLAGANTATLVLADIVKLSEKDQRPRAVLLLRELLIEMGDHPVFQHHPDGVLEVKVPEFLLQQVQEIIMTSATVHSFVPAGVAIVVQAPSE